MEARTELLGSAMNFDGSTWQYVGIPGFSQGGLSDLSFAFHPSTSQATLAYRDYANSDKTTVMAYNCEVYGCMDSAACNFDNSATADDAMKMFLQEIKAAGTSACEYQAKIFGGGNMFSKIVSSPSCTPSYGKCFQSQSTNCTKVSCKNALVAPYLLEKNGFKLTL